MLFIFQKNLVEEKCRANQANNEEPTGVKRKRKPSTTASSSNN